MIELRNIKDEVSYQMGVNLNQYKKIEYILKNLIRVSSKTVQLTKKGEPNIWSNRDNVAKSTLGTLLQQIEKANKKKDIEEDIDEKNSDNNDNVGTYFSYEIPIIFRDFDKFKEDFSQIVSQRNYLIHHFYMEDGYTLEKILERLKQEYKLAENFIQNRLLPIAHNMNSKLKRISQNMESYFLNSERIIAYFIFLQIYEQNKRADNWIVLPTILQKIQKEYPSFLESLKEGSCYKGKKATWKNILHEAYPEWEFKEEITKKGGKRVLIKIMPSGIVLRSNE
jgi:hypothetical protein